MFATLTKLLKNEHGATAIEYGLIAALIAVAAVTVLGTVGSNLTTTFSTVATKLYASFGQIDARWHRRCRAFLFLPFPRVPLVLTCQCPGNRRTGARFACRIKQRTKG